MAVKVAPWGPKWQELLATGLPAVGNKLFFYVAGSVNTKQNTYTDSTGGSTNPNPIILNALGEQPNEVWFTAGQLYKVVYAPSTDTDPPTSPIWTIDNLSGQNDTSISGVDEWQDSGFVPTYVSATSFTVPGDQTTTLAVGRRLKSTVTAGTAYSTIVTTAYAAVTTVTVANDVGSNTLDSGLSAVQVGIIRPVNPSIQADMIHRKAAAIASATTTDIWKIAGDFAHITGVTTITGLGTAPYAGAEREIVFDGILTLTHNATSLILPGGANITTAAGDRMTVIADTTANMIVTQYTKAAGTSVITSTTTVASVRQTVLSGPVTAAGLPNFGGSTGTTTVTASGTLIPTNANGFSSTGAVDNIASIVNPSWTGLSTNGIMYLYATYSAGVWTTASTTIAPTYQWGGTPSVTSATLTFNIQEMIGYLGNGATAPQTNWVAVGEVFVSGSVVSTITWYALMGRYEAPFTATLPATATLTSFNHNIGIRPKVFALIVECTSAEHNYSIGDQVGNPTTNWGGVVAAPVVVPAVKTISFTTGVTQSVQGQNKTTGGSAVFTLASWKYKMTADRGW